GLGTQHGKQFDKVTWSYAHCLRIQEKCSNFWHDWIGRNFRDIKKGLQWDAIDSRAVEQQQFLVEMSKISHIRDVNLVFNQHIRYSHTLVHSSIQSGIYPLYTLFMVDMQEKI
ncbi:hypothetical protein QZH41_017550, partial [Actinostola sp. cb2023]